MWRDIGTAEFFSFDTLVILAIAVISYIILRHRSNKKSIEQSIIDKWISTDSSDKDVYLEFISEKEWRASLPCGKLVKGSWDSSAHKFSPDALRYVYHISDSDGNIYRMDFKGSPKAEDERIVLFMESGERTKFVRLSKGA